MSPLFPPRVGRASWGSSGRCDGSGWLLSRGERGGGFWGQGEQKRLVGHREWVLVL